ncbi:MAG: hypothetical protein K5Q68_14905 [Roseococcus sp.]|nr:hypothetical protein [Roseococcus sp.]
MSKSETTGVTMGWKMAECENEPTAAELARRCEMFKVLRGKIEEISARLKTYDDMSDISVAELAAELDRLLAEVAA